MYWKHKIYIHFLWLLLFSANLYSGSFLDTVRGFFSFGLSSDILSGINKDIVGSLRAKKIQFFLPNGVEIDEVEVLDEFGERVLYAKHVKLAISLFSFTIKKQALR